MDEIKTLIFYHLIECNFYQYYLKLHNFLYDDNGMLTNLDVLEHTKIQSLVTLKLLTTPRIELTLLFGKFE